MRNDIETGFSFDGFSFEKDLLSPESPKKTFSVYDNDADNDLKIMPVNIGVYYPKFNRQGNFRWLSIRTWDTSEKKQQIQWMKQVKAEQNPVAIDMIAREFETTIRELIRRTDCCFVCNAPQGHSKTKKHFISEVGKVLAKKLGCPYVKMFADRHISGSTYPRVQNDRGEIKVIGHSEKPVCILIDDVCTSGMTMISCIQALKDEYTLIPVSWIYRKRKS